MGNRWMTVSFLKCDYLTQAGMTGGDAAGQQSAPQLASADGAEKQKPAAS